jgi:hypothetical protein
MKHTKSTPSAVDFYEEQVLPDVLAHLHAVFGELKLERTGKGWTAPNYDEAKALLARAESVVCTRPVCSSATRIVLGRSLPVRLPSLLHVVAPPCRRSPLSRRLVARISLSLHALRFRPCNLTARRSQGV